MADGPSVEADIWQHYQSAAPGQVQVLGPDLFNDTPQGVTQFKNSTGATYPLLLNGSMGAGNENLFTVYGDRDNYAVINKVGIVRYHAHDHWPYGNRYHLGELTGCIDTLVTGLVGVDPSPTQHGFSLHALPNPFRGSTRLELTIPAGVSGDARVTVYDLAGREVARLWNSTISPGATTLTWDGRRRDGARAAPGVYLVRARVGNLQLMRRLLLIP